MFVLLLRHMFKIEPRENKHLTSEHQLRCKGNVLLCSNAVAKCLRYLINRKNDIDDLIFFATLRLVAPRSGLDRWLMVPWLWCYSRTLILLQLLLKQRLNW